MAQSKANHTDGNASTRQVAVATRALCWSFDIAAIFLTLYQFGCRFVFSLSHSLWQPQTKYTTFFMALFRFVVYIVSLAFLAHKKNWQQLLQTFASYEMCIFFAICTVFFVFLRRCGCWCVSSATVCARTRARNGLIISFSFISYEFLIFFPFRPFIMCKNFNFADGIAYFHHFSLCLCVRILHLTNDRKPLSVVHARKRAQCWKFEMRTEKRFNGERARGRDCENERVTKSHRDRPNLKGCLLILPCCHLQHHNRCRRVRSIPQ